MTMNFGLADLYPNFAGLDTSTSVAPEPDDQSALCEDAVVAETANAKTASTKNIFIVLAVLVGLIVFFGGN